MPLSKARNRERMRRNRLHKRLCPPYQSKPVQPKLSPGMVDADENPVYELT